MAADAPADDLYPPFPITPTKKQLREVTAALLVDSLSAMGLSQPSSDVDASALQKWLFDYTGGLNYSLESEYGYEGSVRHSEMFFRLPSIENPAALSKIELLAIRSRVLAVAELLDPESRSDRDKVRWWVYRQSMFAHQTLARESSHGVRLRAPTVVARILEGLPKNPRPMGWARGLTAEDVEAIVVERLLDTDSIYLDHLGWFKLLQDGSLGPDMFTTEIDQTTASAAVRRLIEARVGDRADRVQRVISELHALSDMEHELVEDSLIDPFVTCLRIGPAERFSLGPRGHLVLASAFHSDSTSATLPEGFAEGLDFVSAPGETSDAHGDDRSPAHNHTPDDRDLAYETIASARAFIVWRGAPRSAAEARTQIPLLLRSTVRTAWLAALANEPRLEYFLDSRYQERDWWYRGAVVSVTHAMRTMVIARNPEPFPIRSWMAFVLGQAIPAGGSTIDTPSFGINAVRLLNSADELLRIDPSQSFACSMAAVEAGLGSRGSELGEKIGRRATRLLIPELAGRKGAQELFKRLYNLRSRVVHGDTCAVTPRQAVFMRYVASCVTYALAGFAKAEAMFGNPSSEDAIRKSLDQSEFEPGQPIGTIEPSFLISVLRSDRALSSWVGD